MKYQTKVALRIYAEAIGISAFQAIVNTTLVLGFLALYNKKYSK